MFLAVLPYLISGGILAYLGYKNMSEYNKASGSIIITLGLLLILYAMYKAK
jgi:sulfite exporter TauE/SafE